MPENEIRTGFHENTVGLAETLLEIAATDPIAAAMLLSGITFVLSAGVIGVLTPRRNLSKAERERPSREVRRRPPDRRISTGTGGEAHAAPTNTAARRDTATTESTGDSEAGSTGAGDITGGHDAGNESVSDSGPDRPTETPGRDADKELVGQLVERLRSEDATERKAAVEKLDRIADERPSLVEPAVEKLRDLRLDPDRGVSRTASDVLEKLPDDRRP